MRFPEFTDEWKEVKLGEVADRINKKNTGGVARVLTISAQYGLVEQEDFFSKRVSSVDLSNYILVKKGEFAYNKSYSHGYPWGAIKRLDQYAEGVLSPLYICFRLKDDGVDSDYLQQYFEGSQWHKEISLIAMEGARNHGLLNITIQDFFNLPLRLPSLAEQRKIAGLLSLIDERIEVQNAIIKEREAQKAALLRRLFDRTLRFPEFTDEWTQTTIGEICKVSTGEMNTQDKIEDGMYPFYVRSSKIERANRYTYDGVAILTPGDGAIGQIFHYSKGKIAVHQRVYMLTEMQCIPKYLFHCFSARFFGRVNRMSAKNTVDSVRMNMITDMPIPLPSLPEQQKIAALLSAIDERLDVERAYAEQLKQQKAYLLRQMFI